MMTFLDNNPRPSTRLHRGDLILAGSAVIDTGRVRARLDAFLDRHRRYIEAQAAVNEAAALAKHERGVVDRLDGVLNHALVILSAALQLNGEPQRNPFARFAPLGPGKMKLLSCRRKIAAVGELAANLRGALGVSPAVLEAAAAAEQAAAQVETALAGWTLRCSYLCLARQSRDALGIQWDDAHRALDLLCRSIIEEPLLHAVLFARPTRARRSAKDSAVADPPSPQAEVPMEESRRIAEAQPAPATEPIVDAAEDPLRFVRRLIEPFVRTSHGATAASLTHGEVGLVPGGAVDVLNAVRCPRPLPDRPGAFDRARSELGDEELNRGRNRILNHRERQGHGGKIETLSDSESPAS